ncbi:MAG: serine/threonine protein kinase [Denitrovibrio sp.]|nr:MAG: serine/threonine protein kinase [Denitrovibrio sp.]
MGRKKQTQSLNIFMNNHLVGSLNRASSGKLELLYTDEWISSEQSRSISLSLPVVSKRHIGASVDSYFDNLLPDNENIRMRIQRRFKIQSSSSFDILAETGRDCVGALQLLPADSEPETIQQINAEPLDDKQIADMLKGYQRSPLGMGEDNDFRISIAGAQEKTALLFYNGKWCRPKGATPTSHIIKLPIGNITSNNIDLSESVENEWLCHLILKTFGIPIANAEIVTFEDMKVLAVERFDRKWIDDEKWIIRLPQEDFCQAKGIPPAIKYESDGGPDIKDIMDTLLGSSNNEEDRFIFMKSVFLFWVMGAVDGHAKNFSIFLEAGNNYRLTPLYDVISIYPIIAKKQIHPSKVKMAMSVVGTKKKYLWERIHVDNWIRTADACNFSKEAMHEIINEMLSTIDDVIEKVKSQLPNDFPTHISEPIFRYMQEIKKKCLNDLVSE